MGQLKHVNPQAMTACGSVQGSIGAVVQVKILNRRKSGSSSQGVTGTHGKGPSKGGGEGAGGGGSGEGGGGEVAGGGGAMTACNTHGSKDAISMPSSAHPITTTRGDSPLPTYRARLVNSAAEWDGYSIRVGEQRVEQAQASWVASRGVSEDQEDYLGVCRRNISTCTAAPLSHVFFLFVALRPAPFFTCIRWYLTGRLSTTFPRCRL